MPYDVPAADDSGRCGRPLPCGAPPTAGHKCFSAAEHIGSMGPTLLIGLCKTCSGRGKTGELSGCGGTFLEIFRIMKFGGPFELSR